jgi:hypothetical protein
LSSCIFIEKASSPAGGEAVRAAGGDDRDVTEHPRATAADAVLALLVLGVRGGVLAATVFTRAVRPAGDLLLYSDRWPCETLRLLAEAGLRYRRNAVADVVRRYHAAVPVVVADVLDQLDLAGTARDLVAAVDLPRIVQDATATVMSENVRGVRLQAYAADRTVSRWMDRVLGRGAPAG